MRTLVRNRTPFWYALYTESVPDTDEDGYFTGENSPQYTEPVLYEVGNISSAKGDAQIEQFGNLENYDKVIVTGDMECPIDENSILWIDETDPTKPYDYVVTRIGKSINGIAIAVRKVKVEHVS